MGVMGEMGVRRAGCVDSQGTGRGRAGVGAQGVDIQLQKARFGARSAEVTAARVQFKQRVLAPQNPF